MNIFPPQEWTSVLLLVLHASVLWSVWALPAPPPKVRIGNVDHLKLKKKALITIFPFAGGPDGDCFQKSKG